MVGGARVYGWVFAQIWDVEVEWEDCTVAVEVCGLHVEFG